MGSFIGWEVAHGYCDCLWRREPRRAGWFVGRDRVLWAVGVGAGQASALIVAVTFGWGGPLWVIGAWLFLFLGFFTLFGSWLTEWSSASAPARDPTTPNPEQPNRFTERLASRRVPVSTLCAPVNAYRPDLGSGAERRPARCVYKTAVGAHHLHLTSTSQHATRPWREPASGSWRHIRIQPRMSRGRVGWTSPHS